ncbi:hypothetical protein IW140_004662 [Coemansia sp. RSA 1813]|nr:hypothetical protein EV178_004703 [Coemansia sp. RSA 1646]KAJ1767626.1 hypothetical protein LPJ74_005261 [Coemansia sp. RSA 1843]KAJ2087616.1 hypothetical protein IW138_004819 [Coemansia sp. RSA 986]KAJ2214361.1 hypothetical protein EV179_003026 [Coemansia sp. RSA 487]KAJ2567095.1 hypothetical protein IW140_004662 [Coemansia sp. RSA 1813]
MRLSVLLAQCAAATTVLAAPSLLVRSNEEIEAEGGDSLSNGPAAVSNPNINNGFQVDSSLVDDGSKDGGDIFANNFGTSFTNVKSNSANKDNIVINPTTVNSNGNAGKTANGQGNNIGDSETVVPGVLFRRDARVIGGTLESYYAQPGYAYAPVYGAPVNYAPYAGFGYAGPYAGAQANYNFQDASIVQNQVRHGYY